MNSRDVAQLQAYHREALTDHLVTERALQVAPHFDEDVTPLREKRDGLRHLAAGFSQLAANAGRVN